MIGPADRPANALDDEVMISRITENAFIVAGCGVENAALALRAHPRPRLLLVALLAHHQNVPIAGQPMMLVGFVPGLELLDALHGGMLGIDDTCAEDAGFMALELTAHQRDVFRRIEETVRGTVQRDQTLAVLDEIEQCLLLLRRNLRVIGIDDETIVTRQVLGIKTIEIVGIGHVDAGAGQRRQNVAGAFDGLVMAVVAEKQHFDPRRFRMCGGTHESQQATDDTENLRHDGTLPSIDRFARNDQSMDSSFRAGSLTILLPSFSEKCVERRDTGCSSTRSGRGRCRPHARCAAPPSPSDRHARPG